MSVMAQTPIIVHLILVLLLSEGPVARAGDSPTASAGGERSAHANRCILDWGLPACSLHPGECLQRTERVCLLPAAWARISTRYREMAAELEDWPEHCQRLRDADRRLCDDLVSAADAECDAKVEATLEAAKKATTPPLWPRVSTAVLAGVAVAGAVWCALDDQPGSWPCWVGGGAGVSAVGIAVFGW